MDNIEELLKKKEDPIKIDPFADTTPSLLNRDPNMQIPEVETVREPNRINAIGAALSQDSMAFSVMNYLSDTGNAMLTNTDENFNIENHMDLYNGVDSAYWDELADAKNLDHAKHLSRKYKKMTQDVDYLNSLGVEGEMYKVGALLTDVPFISLMQKVRFAGKAGSFLDRTQQSYIGRALGAGIIEGGFEAIKRQTSPAERDNLDMLLAVTGGAILGGLYKPKLYDSDTVQAMKDMTTDTMGSMARGEDPALSKKVQDTVNDSQINVTAAFKNSPSPTMNSFGNKMFNDVLNPEMDNFKSIEVRDNVKDAIDNAFNMHFQPIYFKYMDAMYGKHKVFNATRRRLDTVKQDEFFNLAGDYFYKRSNPLLDQVPDEIKADLDKAFKGMSNDSYDIMLKNGHTKFVDGTIDKADDYMKLSWLKDKLQNDVISGRFKKNDFRKAVADGLRKKFTKLGIQASEESIKKASKVFTDTLMTKAVQVGKEGFLQQDNVMKKAMAELQQIMNLTDEEVDLVMGQVKKNNDKSKGGTATSTKMRTPLDLDGEFVNKAGVKVSLKDYVDTNIQSAWHSYGHSMGGDTALRRMGIQTRDELYKMRDQVAKELSDNLGRIKPENEKYMTNFDNAIAHLLGLSTKTDPNGDMWKGVRTLNNLTRASKLGATWFAMSVEVARISHRVGVKNMIKALPALKQMSKAYKGQEFDKVYRELMLHEALGGELNNMVSIAKYEDNLVKAQGEMSQRFIDRAERFGDIANEAVMLAGGVKTGTAYLEYLHAISARVKMMDMARNANALGKMKPEAYDYFRHYGFSEEMADKISAQIRRFADPNEPLLNLDKWEDGLGHQWSLGVRRQSYELVQKSNYGDNVAMTMEGKLIGDTMLGSLAMNLKNYMLVAYNKQLSKGVVNLAKGGKDRMDVLGNWTYQTAFAATAYTAKAYIQYGNDQEKLDKILSPERIAAGTFSMLTFSTFIPSVADTVAQGITGESIFNVGARGEPAGLPTIAPVSYAKDVVGAGLTMTKLLSPWGEASEYELQKAFGTLPLGNALGVKALTSELAALLAEENL